MAELTEIKKKIEELRAEESALETANFKQRVIPQAQAFIGQTFVYRNNNSGGNERWDVFRRAVAFEFDNYSGWMLFEECQVRADCGHAELETACELIHRDEKQLRFLERGWKPCTKDEFIAAKQAALRQLENPTMAVAIIKKDRLHTT